MPEPQEEAVVSESNVNYEVARLKAFLEQSSTRTKAFVRPLLSEPVAQHVLLNFAADAENVNEFEDLLWDPKVQFRLEQVLLSKGTPVQQAIEARYGLEVCRQAGRENPLRPVPQSPGFPPQDVILIDFEAEALLLSCESARAAAKREFSDNRFEAAAKGYARTAKLLFGKRARSSNLQSDLSRERLSCLCSAAVCGFKARLFDETAKWCSEALAADPSCAKALYWRARVRVQQKMYDPALLDLQAASSVDPTNSEVSTLLRRVSLTIDAVKAEQKQRAATILAEEKAATAAAAAAEAAAEAAARAKPKPTPEEAEAAEAKENEDFRAPKPRRMTNSRESATVLLSNLGDKFPTAYDWLEVEGGDEETQGEHFEALGGQRGYLCRMRGKGGLKVEAAALNKKHSRLLASCKMLQALGRLWNEQNPQEEPIDIENDLKMPEIAPKSEGGGAGPNKIVHRKEPTLEEQREIVGNAFADYCDAWIKLISGLQGHQLTFPPIFDKRQRHYLYTVSTHYPDVYSNSVAFLAKKGARQVVSMNRSLMYGVSLREEKCFINVRVPLPPKMPSDVKLEDISTKEQSAAVDEKTLEKAKAETANQSQEANDINSNLKGVAAEQPGPSDGGDGSGASAAASAPESCGGAAEPTNDAVEASAHNGDEKANEQEGGSAAGLDEAAAAAVGSGVAPDSAYECLK